MGLFVKTWTDAKDETLKAHLANGESASFIGKAMGVTRNAIIGRSHRLGIRKIRRVAGPRPPRRRSKAPQSNPVATTQRLRVKPFMAGPQVVTHAVYEGAAYEAPATRKTLLELTERDCRWPCGDPGTESFFFCGAPQVDGKPYCPTHCAIAYAPTPRLTSQRVRYNEAAAA